MKNAFYRIIFIIVIYNFILMKCESKTDDDNTVGYCSTLACSRESKNILSKLDTSVDACDDFYKHVCGTFIQNTKIPDDKTSVDVSTELDDKLKAQLNEILNSSISKDDIEPFKHSKMLYKACMNKELIEEQELKPIKKQLDAVGGWPVVEGKNWQENVWAWQKIQLELETRGFGTNYIFDCSVEVDMKNSSKRVIYIDQMSLGMEREYLIKGFYYANVQAYYNYMVDTAVIYGAERFSAELEMKDVLTFEIRLAEISKPKEERRNMTLLYNPITIREFQKLFPIHDWYKYFNQLIKNNNISEDEIIIMTDFKEIVGQLNELLKVTPNRVVVNYLLWRTASTVADILNDKIRERHMEFQRNISGQKSFEERWEECIDTVLLYLPVATSALYVKHFFKESSKDAALELVKAIQEEFENTLKATDWMDEETRKEALHKAKLMERHIGYPNELTDNLKLKDYYEGLVINEKNYFDTVLNISKLEARRTMKNFRKPVNRTNWEDHAHVAIINAFYNPVENSIQFPAGILQGVYFSADRPKYLNYAAIGSIIGHEITHGYDDEGSQFDANGNIVDWWQEDTKQAYLEKARCIIDQYGNFTESSTQMNINGINTQGENIADNGGLMQAYKAYLRYVEKHGDELPLPGLNYTSRQLFWISFASTWCSVERPESMKLMITMDTHAPEEFRVNGVVMNMPEFSEDFDCPPEANMNAENKCSVW